MSFLEYFLQFLQLQTGESCSVSPFLAAGDIAVTLITKFIQFPLLLHAFHRRHPDIAAIVHGPAQLCVKRLSFHFSNPIVHCTQGGGGKYLVKGEALDSRIYIKQFHKEPDSMCLRISMQDRGKGISNINHMRSKSTKSHWILTENCIWKYNLKSFSVRRLHESTWIFLLCHKSS